MISSILCTKWKNSAVRKNCAYPPIENYPPIVREIAEIVTAHPPTQVIVLTHLRKLLCSPTYASYCAQPPTQVIVLTHLRKLLCSPTYASYCAQPPTQVIVLNHLRKLLC